MMEHSDGHDAHDARDAHNDAINDANDDAIEYLSRPPASGFFQEMEPGRRGEILDAAAVVFSEKGYDSGSMRDIARRVGVSEPALYRHFDGKQALFTVLLKTAGGRLRKEAFTLIDGVAPETLRAQLIDAMSDRRRAMRLYGPILRTVITAAAHHRGFLETYRSEIVEPIRERLTSKAAEMDDAYGIADAATTRDARVRAVMALFVGYFITSIVLADESDQAIADAFLRVMGWETAASSG